MKNNSLSASQPITGHKFGYLLLSLMLLVFCFAMGSGCGSRSGSAGKSVKAAGKPENDPRLEKLISRIEKKYRGGFYSFVHRNEAGEIDRVALYGNDAVEENEEP